MGNDNNDNKRRFHRRYAKLLMDNLFSKKLTQIVAVWIKRVAKTSLDMLHQRKKTFDETRTKYVTYYADLCTFVRDKETMEKLCDRIRSNKTLSEHLKIQWSSTFLNGLYVLVRAFTSDTLFEHFNTNAGMISFIEILRNSKQ